MGLFSDKKAEQDGDTGVEGEVERLGALPLPEQVLEHAGLVQSTVWGGKGGLYFVATRLGKSALERNTVDQAIGGT
jgi:hypothetical protein